MKICKRLLLFLLCAITLIGALPIQSFAEGAKDAQAPAIPEKYLHIIAIHSKNDEYVSDNEMEYNIELKITNVSDRTAQGVSVILGLPKEMTVISDEDKPIFLGDIEPGETITATCATRVSVEYKNTSATYLVIATDKQGVQVSQEKRICFGDTVLFYNYITSRPLDASWSHAYFDENNGYDHSLAWLSLCLELASWTNNEEKNWGAGDLYDANAVKPNSSSVANERYENLENAYTALGFDDTLYYNYNVTLNDTSDKVAFSIATKKDVCGATLISVVIRGGYYGSEWSSNFNIGDGQEHHEGFYTAAEAVYDKIFTDPDHSAADGNIKLWITGYSRGAAVANLLAARLCEDSETSEHFDKEDIFTYTFATPKGIIGKDELSCGLYEGIYNVINPGDMIPLVALEEWGFTRYGSTKFFAPPQISSHAEETLAAVNENYYYFTSSEIDAKANLDLAPKLKETLRVLYELYPQLDQSQDFQWVLSELFEFVMTRNENSDGDFVNISPKAFLSVLKDRYGDKYTEALAAADTFITNNKDLKLIMMLVPRDYVRVVFTVGCLHGFSGEELFDLINHIINSIDLDGISIEGHFPELYTSWMMQNEYAAFGTSADVDMTAAVTRPKKFSTRDGLGNSISALPTTDANANVIDATDKFSSTERVSLNLAISSDSPAEISEFYAKGSVITLTAAEKQGYSFEGWYVDGRLACEDISCTVRLTDNVEISAVFEECEHVWNGGNVIRAATHTEHGEIEYTCTLCESLKTERIEKTAEHSFGEWAVIKEATETESGIRKRTCECGHSISEEIAATGADTKDEQTENEAEAPDTSKPDGVSDTVIILSIAAGALCILASTFAIKLIKRKKL